MNHRRITLFLYGFLALSVCQLWSVPAQTKQTISPSFDRFSAATGFSGTNTETSDGRIFSKLNGNFNLPEPTDASILCRNSDAIVKALMAIYKEQGANYTLKMVSSHGYTHSCQYIQYWKQFNLVNQPYYLLITYHPDTKQYSIHNNLYMGKIEIPEKAISFLTVNNILDFINSENKMNPNLADVPIQMTTVDTMRIYYNGPFADNDYESLNLNLFPDSSSIKAQGFMLQWKKEIDNINAKTGKLIGHTEKRWEKKVKLINAANGFIKSADLTGNCDAYIQHNHISFTDIHLGSSSIKDSISFRHSIVRFIPYYVNMYKQLGVDIKIAYFQTDYRHDDHYQTKQFEAYYKQVFKYPVQAYENTYFVMTAQYELPSDNLTLNDSFFKGSISYPDSVMTPQNVLDLNILAHLYDRYSSEIKSFPKIYVHLDSIIPNKVYKDPRFNLYAKLEMQSMGNPEHEGITGMTLTWHVFDGIDRNMDKYYDPVKGFAYDGSDYDSEPVVLDNKSKKLMEIEQDKINRAFNSIGMTKNYHFNNQRKRIDSFDGEFNLPVPADSSALFENCQAIGRSLFNLYQINDTNYSIVAKAFERSNGISMGFQFAYEGIEIGTSSDAPYYGMGFYVVYESSYKKYSVSLSSFQPVKSVPDCVITPETALLIAKKSALKQFVWTELSTVSGEIDYFKHPPLVPGKERNDSNDDREAGYIILKFVLITYNNTNPIEKEYRLVWAVQPYDGESFIIDAETGEILHHEEWDTC